jgi:hypothetical protein
MAGGVVCYLERHGGGSQIRRVRLVAAGLVRVWTAPESGSVSSVDDTGPGPAVSGVKAAAAFVAQTLASVGLKRLSCVCVDADGAVCAWLSALSPDSTVIKATVQQAGGESDSAGAGVGAARLLAMSTGTASGGFADSDVTLQALAVAEPEVETSPNGNGHSPGLRQLPGKLLKRSNGSAASPSLTRKTRYAVLAVPDAPVRVFLDELDRLGVEVETVRSLWHALAEAWDPSADRSGAKRSSVIDSQGPASGVVMIDPSGRLIWAWTLGAELVAGGTMRLASYARPGAATDEQPGDAPTIDSSRRLPGAAPDDGPPVLLEFTEADAGRLVMDWLAWSAQLGHCPRRIVCLACPNLGSHTSSDGPRVLPALLAKSWPGATVDGAVNDDPIGATLARLAGLGPTPTSPTIDTPTLTGSRHELVGLTSRPGRADRSLHRWIAVALFGLAGVLGVGAWQIYRSVGAVTSQEQAITTQRREVENELRVLVGDDNFSRSTLDKQKELIAGVLKSKQTTLRNLKPPRPVIEETVNVLKALEPATDAEVTDFEVNPIFIKVQLVVPDSDTGPGALERLRTASARLTWDGWTPPIRSQNQRQYVLMGTWNDAGVSRPAAGGAKP